MFCLKCGKQSTTPANFCSNCGAALPPIPTPYGQTRIVRPRHPRVIAGVCAGVALYYNRDLTLIRVLLVVATVLTSGLGILVYIAAWILIPDAPYALPAATYPQPTTTASVI